jgi:hypothetical protein
MPVFTEKIGFIVKKAKFFSAAYMFKFHRVRGTTTRAGLLRENVRG